MAAKVRSAHFQTRHVRQLQQPIYAWLRVERAMLADCLQLSIARADTALPIVLTAGVQACMGPAAAVGSGLSEGSS